MEWKFQNDRPIYTQIMGQIEKAVVSGVFSPGDRLPGVRELAANAGVNPNTMQRALAELEMKGLLQAQRTSGRFVTEDAAHIVSLREELAVAATGEYWSSMCALGCSSEEIEAYVKREKEGN